MGHQVYIVNAATARGSRRLTPFEGGMRATVHPDGSRVLLRQPGPPLRPTSRLEAHDVSRREEKVLVDWPAPQLQALPTLDGSEIAFTSTITGRLARSTGNA